MNKKIKHYLGLTLLLLPLLPFSLTYAETVEEVPTGESTISSMADDPLKEYKEKAANQVSTIESTPETEATESQPEVNSTEDTPTSESSNEDIPEAEVKSKPQTKGGIGPQTVNLIEGVDIDADFAQLLRTDASVQNLGTSWSGYGKAQDQLTDDDMVALNQIGVAFKNLNSLMGIEYAVNLTNLICPGNSLNSLDLSANTALASLSCPDNQLTSLNLSTNTALTTLICNNNQLTNLDVSASTLLTYFFCNDNKLVDLDISANTSLVDLNCSMNVLTSLDITSNILLKNLYCFNNKLTSLDAHDHPSLRVLECYVNELNTLNLNGALALEELNCGGNKLTTLDVSDLTSLWFLVCGENGMTNLILDGAIALRELDCDINKLTSLDLSTNVALQRLVCTRNSISSLDLSNNKDLRSLTCWMNEISNLNLEGLTLLNYLDCNTNKLTELDVSDLISLRNLNCAINELTSLNVNGAIALEMLECYGNKLTDIDTSTNLLMQWFNCNNNNLDDLDVSKNTLLTNFDCSQNKLIDLDVSMNSLLEKLICENNQLTDITSANNLNQLVELSAGFQKIILPIPIVSVGGEAEVDILKTTGHAGLSASNIDITPSPSFTYNGDKILMSNVTRFSLSDKSISFSYDGSQLTEGASSGTKSFGGTITFFSASDLVHTIVPNKKKVYSGEKLKWTWTIESMSVKKAEDTYAEVSLPAGLVIDPSSITKDGGPATLADINGTNNHGDLNYGETIEFTFETTATGIVNDWLKAKGRVDWDDDTITGPYNNETEGLVQIQDDEQTYTPKDSDDMALQSVPIYFNHGTNPIVNTAQTHHLHSMNYQSNTNVVTDGFYTRIKDDRSVSTGWKLTAKLSDFKDSSNSLMPNGTGTSLKLENMSIERVTDRDTPQETIDPSPTGADVPSSVQTTETLVAGQPTAKTLVSAQPNEGQDTWQLRMPFDKISLNLPANAGKKGTIYKAKLTWSLDDTP
ncbi:WxL domain-containing protein [Enterococcus raffinosus]|uniref:WxL domain-containing protein n=1 Tax=Enterococcus raffinosus TaxID=71452 RepID=A0AAW8SPK6_9ENTE|nr:WxL domain-containing protein [Enterococcus raffinosus]MDK7989092.1 WxL domain-containing protein [Enterococcus raffinosus]MDT2536795.1 WxL domain-containing protein [Enterococcus raffinosus]UXJ98083.1 WxL domain-containing protein [Enterococcus raffinosus]